MSELTGTSAALVAPSAPSNLSVSVTGSTVTLTWQPPSSGDAVSSYVIDAGTSAGSSNITSFDTGSSSASLTVSQVPNGTYFVRARAKNGAGTSGASNEVQAVVGSTSCQAAPDPPTDMTSSLDGNILTLSWKAPAGGCPVESYTLEAGTTPDGTDLADFDTGSTKTTFTADLGSGAQTVGGLVSAAFPGTIYTRTKTKNKWGKSKASNTTTITPKTSTVVPCTNCSKKYDAVLKQCQEDYPDTASKGWGTCSGAAAKAYADCGKYGRWPGCVD